MDNTLFTIGHSNLTIDVFISYLKKYNIDCIGDVRSVTFSQYNTCFQTPKLYPVLKEHNIKYVYLGNEFGAKRDESEVYNTEGCAIYSEIAKTDQFKHGLTRLDTGIKKHTIALMSSEAHPIKSHRAILICRYLPETYDIHHILKDGSIISHKELEQSMLELYAHNPKKAVLDTVYDQHSLNICYRR